jgi:hypothetical protein
MAILIVVFCAAAVTFYIRVFVALLKEQRVRIGFLPVHPVELPVNAGFGDLDGSSPKESVSCASPLPPSQRFAASAADC